ncbi:GNAT family N-acetyltransferase [Rhodovulum sp. DZ06]|uniref:GNAT family N-acetyltransferase n=1 Tax=Rhodovulum sp. DZ06 TaxID=3425126 RepID=UPI003D33A7E7
MVDLFSIPAPGPRVAFRPLRAPDRDAFAAMHMDKQVSDWLGRRFTRADADALFGVLSDGRPWALDAGHGFIGLAGLRPIPADLPPHAPGALEILWRLAPAAQGRGYASEAARALLAHGFAQGAEGIRAWTARANARSQAVAARIGMQRRPDLDFLHPALPRNHSLCAHVVYCMQRCSWHEG